MRTLIYGSYGYTGELIVDLAVERNARPVLAGRSAEKIELQAAAADLDGRCFSLDSPGAIDRGLEGIDVVLHCAGPFSRTARPMAEACLRTRTHYLDITGEIEVFEALASMDTRAKESGVMLMPGVGFDVVPSDCLSAHLKSRVPDAERLTLAINAVGTPSRGTATTMIENIHKGGLIRRDGKLTEVPAAWQTESFDFGNGPVQCMTIPWGDVSTAFYSTGIPNIEVYMAVPPRMRSLAKTSRRFGWLLGSKPVQKLLKMQIQAQPRGPDDEQRKNGRSLLLGRVRDSVGNAGETLLKTPEGYTLTAITAWDIAERVGRGEFQPGFQTPSKVFGADYILQFDGVERHDRETTSSA